MVIDLRRGLFRAWVILSVIWVIGPGAIWFLDARRSYLSSGPPRIENAERSLDKAQNVARTAATPEKRYEAAVDAKKIAEILDKRMKVWREVMISLIWFGVLFVLMPPVGVLLLGFGVLWVVSGFRSQD